MRFGLQWAWLLLPVLVGCQGREEPVERRVMTLEETGLVERLPTFRSLAAMIPQAGATWFFKVAGPVARVEEVAAGVREFLGTIRFDDAGEPVWTLPEGWTEHRTRMDRYKTILIPCSQGDPVELAVSSLGGEQNELMNINRWRGQVSLPPISEAGLASQWEILASPAGEIKLFDQTGLWTPGSMNGGPMGMGSPGPDGAPGAAAGQAAAGAGAAAAATSNQAPPAGNATTDAASGVASGPALSGPIPTPEGWSRDPDSSFVVASFRKESAAGKARLAISELPSELNSWETSVGSWIAESAIGDLDPSALAGRTTALKVAGNPAMRLDLASDPSPSDKGLIGIRIESGRQAVYLKLTGDRAAVLEQASLLEAVLPTLPLAPVPAPAAGSNDSGNREPAPPSQDDKGG